MNYTHPSFQSAYRNFSSTETALITITNYINLAFGKDEEVRLVMLDLSAAFDTIDHQTLLRLYKEFGSRDKILKWISSYLYVRRHQVRIYDVLSPAYSLDWGIPQGPILDHYFLLYVAPLERITLAHCLNTMYYADDTQLYIL